MKTSKILTVAAVLGVLASNSYAKTEGHYVGADLMYTDIDWRGGNHSGGLNTYQIQGNNAKSFGFDYKYAWNMDGMYVAPTVFYQYPQATVKDSNYDDWTLKTRYGVGLTLGYDVTEEIAVYGAAYWAGNYYYVNWNSGVASKEDTDWAVSYELGAKYSMTEDLDVKLGYEMTRIEMTEPPSVSNTNKTEFEVEIVKLGLAYNF